MDHQQEDNLTPGKRAALDAGERDVKKRVFTFDKEESSADSMHLERKMKKRYRHSKCRLCDAPCIINQVKNNTKNHGKWYLKCSVQYRNGHTFEFVPIMPHEINMTV